MVSRARWLMVYRYFSWWWYVSREYFPARNMIYILRTNVRYHAVPQLQLMATSSHPGQYVCRENHRSLAAIAYNL